MDKTLLGSWGAVLDDQEYAYAVAGLGVMESRPRFRGAALKVNSFPSSPRIRWRAGLLNAPPSTDFRQTTVDDPRVAAEYWKSGTFRLSIPHEILKWPGLKDPEALLEVLAHAAPRSLIVEAVPLSGRNAQRTWSWPLRIGVLLDADVGALQKQFDADTAPGLVKVIGLDDERETCDLLILASDGGQASTLGTARVGDGLRLRASVVFAELSAREDFYASALHRAETLLFRFQSSAVALVPAMLTASLVGNVLRLLSHNQHFDEAVYEVVRASRIEQSPCILASPRFMESLSLQGVADRYEDLEQFHLPWPIGRARLRGALEEAAPGRHLGELAKRFALEGQFSNETLGASKLAEEMKDLEEELDQHRTPRWLHSDTYSREALLRDSARGATLPSPSDEQGLQVYPDGSLLVIRVSPTTTGPRAPAPVPEDQLDFTAGAVLLHVLIELNGAEVVPLPWTPRSWREILGGRFASQLPHVAPRSGESLGLGIGEGPLELPEAGESSLAPFWLMPHAGISVIRGRIVLLHRNRAIQTVRFTARVPQSVANLGRAGEVNSEPRGSEFCVSPDLQIRPRLDDVADMREFDATLLVADDLGAPPYMTAQRDGETAQLDLSIQAMRDPINRIVSALSLLTRRSAEIDVLPIDSPLAINALYRLASAGRLLYQKLPAWLTAATIRRIQVVTRGELYFPAEFIYEGTAPDPMEFGLCPQTPTALASGECGTCPHQRSAQHLCPLHFWGLTRTLERHTFVSDTPPRAGTDRLPPSPTRRAFSLPTTTVQGASDKAFSFDSSPACVSALHEALAALGPSAQARDATTWRAWCAAAVMQPDPQLFMALPHSEEVNGVSVLELGSGDLLSKAQISGLPLLGNTHEPRLLLLLGCSTAEPTQGFSSYPEEFRAAGADIVVAPLAPILGADCVPIATEIVRALTQIWASGRRTSLGSLMSEVRRNCLVKGHPGVLGIVAYGDADWVFGEAG